MTLPRFYPIVDTMARESPVESAAKILAAGARILQLRHKEHFDRDTFAAAQRIAAMCHDASALFIVNDRADIAMLIDDAGLHLGQDDLPPAEARRLVGSKRVIGFSTHNERQFRDAAREQVDYLAFGPIFGTASKRNPDPTVGVAELARIRSLTSLPLVAIGGITRVNAREVFAAGADSVAVISDLLSGPIEERAREWVALTEAHEYSR